MTVCAPTACGVASSTGRPSSSQSPAPAIKWASAAELTRLADDFPQQLLGGPRRIEQEQIGNILASGRGGEACHLNPAIVAGDSSIA